MERYLRHTAVVDADYRQDPAGADAADEPHLECDSISHRARVDDLSDAVWEAAGFDKKMGEFVLRYEAMRSSDDPDAALLEFLQSTYEAAADCARWDRGALEVAK